jgi:hypothetical protein
VFFRAIRRQSGFFRTGIEEFLDPGFSLRLVELLLDVTQLRAEGFFGFDQFQQFRGKSTCAATQSGEISSASFTLAVISS